MNTTGIVVAQSAPRLHGPSRNTQENAGRLPDDYRKIAGRSRLRSLPCSPASNFGQDSVLSGVQYGPGKYPEVLSVLGGI